MAIGIDQMFVNFQASSLALINFVTIYGAGAMSMVMAGMAALKFREVGDGRMKLHTPLAYLMISGMLWALPSSLDLVSQTMFAHSSFTAMTGNQIDQGTLDSIKGSMGQVNAGAANAKMAALSAQGLAAVMFFIKLIGHIAFIRGFLLLKNAADGKDQMVGRGLTHIFGGAAAVNIELSYAMLARTLLGA